MLGTLEVRCEWEQDDFVTTHATNIPMFDLEIAFSADVTNPDDMQPYLEFKGVAGPTDDADDPSTGKVTKEYPDDIGSDDIEWDGVRLPIAGAFGTPPPIGLRIKIGMLPLGLVVPARSGSRASISMRRAATSTMRSRRASI